MDIEAETESQPRDTFLSEKEHDKLQYEAELKQRQEKEDKELERRTQFIGDYDVRIVEQQYNHLWGYYGEPEEIEALIESLDERGIREGFLKKKLTRKYPKLVSLSQKRNHEISSLRQNATFGYRQTRSTSRSRRPVTVHEIFLYYSNTLAK